MATLTFSTSFNNDWPPDALSGGTITARSATAMTYTSDLGYTVTLRGVGFTYDADGYGSTGNVRSVTIAKDGATYALLTGAATDMSYATLHIFGYDRNGGHNGPDPYGFLQNLLRGDDLITGSAQHDDMRGGSGDDTINAGAGGDYVGAEAGNDVLNGGDDWDTLSFDEAAYRWDAFQGVNLDATTGVAINSWGGVDHFSNFEQYRDTIYNDTMKGSATDEQFDVSRGNDQIDGLGGFDWLSYDQASNWGARRGVNVNLVTGIAIDSWKGTDTIANIEGVQGTDFNDRFLGGAGDETFLGGDGVDVMNGGGGSDSLGFWNVGNNNHPGHGVIINLNLAVNIVDDGYGNAETATSFEQFYGSNYNDRMTGNAGSNNFDGNDGDDTANGGAGEDFLSGGGGNDVLIGGLGNDHMSGNGGNDTLTGGTGQDDFNFGGPFNELGVDTITDMEIGIDEIWVDTEWGGGLTSEFLVANQFRSGAGVTTANTATQRLIYNTLTGDLYFDADGVGGVAAVKFAVLSNHAAITFDDFHVFL